MERACAAGRKVALAEGSVWIRAESEEKSGVFPASVRAGRERLHLEITDPFGGTQAVVHVEGGRYEIRVAGEAARVESGYGSWAGIPLQWATDLFLGRLPCARAEGARVERDGGDELVVSRTGQVPGWSETFRYRFAMTGGNPWVEHLRWDLTGPENHWVEIRFEDPEESTESPLRWEATSDRGSVRVRWKRRQIRRSDPAASRR